VIAHRTPITATTATATAVAGSRNGIYYQNTHFYRNSIAIKQQKQEQELS
jgi:hypothetical protein